MNYSELLKNRRSVRDYFDEDVPTDLLMEMIKESTLAPSSGHRQPWRFVIVKDKNLIKRMSDDSKKNIVAGIDANPNDPRAGYKEILSDESFNVFYNAPALIIIAGESSYNNLLVDCALCAGYVMNAAAARGLGTCYINLGKEVKDKGIRKQLGIPDDHTIVAPIIIGYPVIIPGIPGRNDPVILKIIE